MKIKTTELTGAALDWAVAKCEGLNIIGPDSDWIDTFTGGRHYEKHGEPWAIPSYSFLWAQGGPVIGRERISIDCQQGSPEFWKASCPRWLYFGHGPTPLIAAMRCYVASCLGDELEVPDELVKETV